jgi:5'-nucleotidase / UDP-sugar diphosphatase
MKKTVTILLFLQVLISLQAQPGKKVTIIHTNDLHSRLCEYAPELSYSPLTSTDVKTIGGFSRIAAIINYEKSQSSGTTLVLDAGDFLMGTLFQALEPTTGFQLRLMKKMGYDVVCIGNHEFDYGPVKLAEIVRSSANGGEIPKVLLGNVVFDQDDPADDSLEELFRSGIIARKEVFSRDGIKFGFFSLMGIEADDNAVLAAPITFSNQIAAAKLMVKQLEAEKCDVIICLSHCGIFKDKKGNWSREDIELAEKVKGIDVIISGHTHTKLEKPVIVNGVPIVQTGEYGQYVGCLSVTLEGGKTKVDNYSLFPVDDRTKEDPEIHRLIENQKKEINRVILEPIGMDYEKPVIESGFLLECNEKGNFKESNLAPLVADAIQGYVNKHVRYGTDISVVAVGVIRDKIISGFQTAPDIFRIMSMGEGSDNVPGYPLTRVYVTGKELKNILEALQLAYKSAPGNYCYYSGMKVEYNPEKGLLKKIVKIEIIGQDGKIKNVDFSKKNKTLYSVSTNSYILASIGIIKKMSYGLINIILKDETGNPISDMKDAVIDFDEKTPGTQEGKEWLALMEYLSSMKDMNGNNVPDVDTKYRSVIQTFVEVK